MSLLKNAKQTLFDGYQEALNNPSASCQHQGFIDFVIDNTHLTYKYVLFTAILAKATDATINPLCLQKKSSLPGSYDARSVCHKVIVPFEQTTLNKILGGSNEPYLNKPARFKELDKTNAVRRGNDQAILNELCDNLPLIQTSEDAYECLVYLLSKLIVMRDQEVSKFAFSVDEKYSTPIHLLNYINAALKNSCEGETLTLMVAGVYHLLYSDNQNIKIEVHPVNQSGKSGKEISDLDIYDGTKLINSCELKDKNYTASDVRHAADKVIAGGGSKMLFISGPHATANCDITELQNSYAERNLMLCIVPSDIFFPTTISSINTINCDDFLHYIFYCAKNIKFKETTINYLYSLAKEMMNYS